MFNMFTLNYIGYGVCLLFFFQVHSSCSRNSQNCKHFHWEEQSKLEMNISEGDGNVREQEEESPNSSHWRLCGGEFTIHYYCIYKKMWNQRSWRQRWLMIHVSFFCLRKGIFNTFLCFGFNFIGDCSLFGLIFDSLCLM